MVKEQLQSEYQSIISCFSDPGRLNDEDLWGLSEALHRALLAQAPEGDRFVEAYHLERIGESFQGRRNLGEAGRYYRRVLELEPPRLPEQEERDAIWRHAPILLTTESEFFGLRDVVAFHHPKKRLIAYHLFWEDDYNFPDDYEPCDHEQVWVAYDPESLKAVDIRSFFHSRILASPEAVEEANDSGGRARVRVEWGLHGSLLKGWGKAILSDGHSVIDQLAHNYGGVIKGGRAKDHPLKRGWPSRFEGDFNAYTSFTMEVDTRGHLSSKNLAFTSLFANATIQQNCLGYNFAVKYDWPFDLVPWGRSFEGRAP